MEQVTPNVWTQTGWRGCNPSYVVTSDGVVVIDTPQLPTKAIAMRSEAESHGPIRYVINTEHHVDHIFGNFYFKGAGPVVHHRNSPPSPTRPRRSRPTILTERRSSPAGKSTTPTPTPGPSSSPAT